MPIDDYASARRYLAPLPSLPWRWDDEGEVIAWIDGPTIAFRAELEGVLARLVPFGLPPFSAVVLLLAACRDGWQGESSRLSTMASLVTTLDAASSRSGSENSSCNWTPCMPCPASCATPSAKADLAELVFEECRMRTPTEEAESVRWALSGYLSAETLAPQADLPHGLDSVLRELRYLHEGLEKLDAEKLRLRRARGWTGSSSRRTSICRRPNWRGD